ncbi:hypothetical protein BCR37DRAFT_375769, partial [Protomyces lactucae-debilis]
MRTQHLLIAVLSTVVVQLQATKTSKTAHAKTTELPTKALHPCFWSTDPDDGHGMYPLYIDDSFSYFRLKQPTWQNPAVTTELQDKHLITIRRGDPDVEEKLKIVQNLTFFYGYPNTKQPSKGRKTRLYGIETCQAAQVNGDHGLKWGKRDCPEGLSSAWRFFKGEGEGVSWLYGATVEATIVGAKNRKVFVDHWCPWHYKIQED